MIDYMLFGAGYQGDLRHFEDEQTVVRAVSKPEPHALSGDVISYRAEGFFKFTVEKFHHNDGVYNFAWNEDRPTDDDVRKAIMKFNPHKS